MTVGIMLETKKPSGTGFSAVGSVTPLPGVDRPRVSISSPLDEGHFLTYSLIPLRLAARDAGGELPDAEIAWSLTGNGISRSGTGHQVDLDPPADGGWPSGAYTLTVTATSANGATASATARVTVDTDADNDGIPAAVEAQSCFPAGGDQDPLNAFADSDGDGIPNAADPQPCVQATSYTATEAFSPGQLAYASGGKFVTVAVTLPARDLTQIDPASVHITTIADDEVSTDPRFANLGWSVVGGVGTAKFDRQKLIAYLTARGIHNRTISISVGGSSSAHNWSFDGSDTVNTKG